jgi:4-hydroxybenzoate polyprenyltransferase
MNIQRLLKISRPRFWIYELGPYLIGVAAANAFKHGILLTSPFIVFFIFFTIPANLFIYGINDIFDYETDILNPKKVEYEGLILPAERAKVFTAIAITSVPFLIYACFEHSLPVILLLLAFFFFAGMYSAPPIRAKAKPFLDSFFSAGHYVATGLFAYALSVAMFGMPFHAKPVILVTIAAMLWAIAMHAYSAVPDIKADHEANLKTIATTLQKKGTMLLCLFCYMLAGLCSFPALAALGIFLTCMYVVMMLISLSTTEQQLFRIYTYFPIINALSGMAVFFWVLLK